MNCPICNGRFPVGQIQSHVEQCLIDQDAAMALKVHQEMNKSTPARHPPQTRPETHVPMAQTLSVSHPQPASFTPHSAYSASPIPHPGQVSKSVANIQPHQYQRSPNYAPPSSASAKQAPPAPGNDPRVYGALQSDVDQYNQKIGSSHKQLQQIRDSLQSFSERISLLEMRKHERIIPPVEIASLPPPRYMTMKASQNQQQQPPSSATRGPTAHLPNPQGAVPPTQQDKRQRFFQTAQKFYNDKSGADSFFLGPGHASPPTQAHPPPSPFSLPPPSQMPPKSSPARDPFSITPVQSATKPQPPPPSVRPAETGITDMHVAQIESKWVSMVLQYPEDAEDLILGHLTMLFSQRVKDSKSADRSEVSLSGSHLSDSSLSDSGSRSSEKKEDEKPDYSGNGMQHPLSEYVGQMIGTWNEPFSRMREPSQETLQTAVHMVNGLIATLEDVVLDYYKELSARNVPRSASANARAAAEHRENLVRQGVRGAIWPLFYNDVMKLIRLKTSAEDDVVNQKMKEYMTMNPAHLGIPRDYWLLDMSPDGATNAEGRTWSTPPYYAAIQTFKELSCLYSPEAKLKCVVKSARDLVDSVSTFHKFFGRNPDKYPVGGDELLPIFTYVVIRSGVKNLNSECSFMELFINDDMARGEFGYILATLQTVIAFLSVLDNDSISHSVESVFKAVAKEVEQKKFEDLQQKQHQEAPQPENRRATEPALQSEAIPSLPENYDRHSYGDHSTQESVEMRPVGVAEGSFFETDPSLDTFDGSKSMLEYADVDIPKESVAAGDFNPRA